MNIKDVCPICGSTNTLTDDRNGYCRACGCVAAIKPWTDRPVIMALQGSLDEARAANRKDVAPIINKDALLRARLEREIVVKSHPTGQSTELSPWICAICEAEGPQPSQITHAENCPLSL